MSCISSTYPFSRLLWLHTSVAVHQGRGNNQNWAQLLHTGLELTIPRNPIGGVLAWAQFIVCLVDNQNYFMIVFPILKCRVGIYIFSKWQKIHIVPQIMMWGILDWKAQKKVPLFYFIFCLFRAMPSAYGGSQATGPVGAVAAGLRHSHSNVGSKPGLRPTPQLRAMPDP